MMETSRSYTTSKLGEKKKSATVNSDYSFLPSLRSPVRTQLVKAFKETNLGRKMKVPQIDWRRVV